MTDANAGFRLPPDKVTASCMIYMARVMELRDFISFFFGIIASSASFARALTKESADALKTEAGKYNVGTYNFSNHRQFINEVMLSRAVETFDLYVLLLLREIFEARPELLKSEGAVEISAVLDLKRFDDIVAYIAEKKLHELSFKPLAELRKYIQSRTGVDLFGDEKRYEIVLLASEIRNLIAHNDCRPNEIFEKRIPAHVRANVLTYPMGKIILTDEWVREACYTMDGLAFEFDSTVGAKFGLNTLNRETSFIFR